MEFVIVTLASAIVVLGVLAYWFRSGLNRQIQANEIKDQEVLAARAALGELQQRAQFLAQSYGPVELAEQLAKQLRLEVQKLEYDHRLQQQRAQAEQERLVSEVRKLEAYLANLEESETLLSSGLYRPHYEFSTAVGYSAQLDAICDRQKEAIKAEIAVTTRRGWTLDGDKKAGEKMRKEYIKLVLRAFNGESDSAIAKVNYSNISVMERRIQTAYEAINKIAAINKCEIARDYMGLKLSELRLSHEWAMKKQAEREEQREIREQIREEERTQKELERARDDAERDARRQEVALAKAREEANHAVGAAQAVFAAKIADLESKLADAQSRIRTTSQAELTQTGHVYVLSNIGSFGEGVYKIGMTRRLDPNDRVTELGDASVPFPFDVHAMVKTSNAPSMEKALHERFSSQRVNRENQRKEFFHVTLDQVEAAVKEYAVREPQGVLGEFRFTLVAEAQEYRLSAARKRAERESTAEAAYR